MRSPAAAFLGIVLGRTAGLQKRQLSSGGSLSFQGERDDGIGSPRPVSRPPRLHDTFVRHQLKDEAGNVSPIAGEATAGSCINAGCVAGEVSVFRRVNDSLINAFWRGLESDHLLN